METATEKNELSSKLRGYRVHASNIFHPLSNYLFGKRLLVFLSIKSINIIDNIV